jgi:hypothetical protein
MLPAVSPVQAIVISPEALEIANAYLAEQSVEKASNTLGISADIITETLNRKEVRAYIDNIFLDVGFNNRFKMRQVMDVLISNKLKELDEAEIGSSKDIADLLALSHKMTMEQLDRQIQLEKVRSGSSAPKTQVNMQVNEFGGDTKYSSLIQRLLGANN